MAAFLRENIPIKNPCHMPMDLFLPLGTRIAWKEKTGRVTGYSVGNPPTVIVLVDKNQRDKLWWAAPGDTWESVPLLLLYNGKIAPSVRVIGDD